MDLGAVGVKATTEVIASIVAIIAVVVTVITYVKSERLKRFDKFQQMLNRYSSEGAFVKVRKWIYAEQHGQSDEAHTPSEFEMHLFMAFFEELAVMINSKLMRDDLAAYNIGIDAVRFYEVVEKYHDEKMWLLFNSFAKRMTRRFEELNDGQIADLSI
jgi:hypothetical protein